MDDMPTKCNRCGLEHLPEREHQAIDVCLQAALLRIGVLEWGQQQQTIEDAYLADALKGLQIRAEALARDINDLIRED